MAAHLKRMVLFLSRMLRREAGADCPTADQSELKVRAEAFKGRRTAADQSHAEAQYLLGLMYHNGEGVPRDAAAAAHRYRTAADQGHAEAQYLLGLMYYNGEGVPRNDVHAYRWLDLAAFQSPAGTEGDVAAKARAIVACKLTPAQIAEAQKLAKEWNPTAPKR